MRDRGDRRLEFHLIPSRPGGALKSESTTAAAASKSCSCVWQRSRKPFSLRPRVLFQRSAIKLA